MGADGDGVAAVGLVEPLRVGNAMLCPQGVMGNAVAPKRWLSRPSPCGGRACVARRLAAVGLAAGRRRGARCGMHGG